MKRAARSIRTGVLGEVTLEAAHRGGVFRGLFHFGRQLFNLGHRLSLQEFEKRQVEILHAASAPLACE